MKFFFNSSNNKQALKAKNKFTSKYGQHKSKDADIIIPIGGDGFLLKNLHNFNEFNIPFFGINYGSIGFLMNAKTNENLENIINNAQEISLKALEMKQLILQNKGYLLQ